MTQQSKDEIKQYKIWTLRTDKYQKIPPGEKDGLHFLWYSAKNCKSVSLKIDKGTGWHHEWLIKAKTRANKKTYQQFLTKK